MVHKYKEEDPHLIDMLKKINDDDLNNLEKIHIFYAIHKAYDDIREKDVIEIFTSEEIKRTLN